VTTSNRAVRWLRALAVVLFLFALGHTIGTASPHATRGIRESMLFTAMQGYTFPVMGFERSYWDFYRGFALSISVLQLFMAAIAWQLAGVGRISARAALPMAWTLVVGCVGILLVSLAFFFTAPIVFAAASVLCAAAALRALRVAAGG
jgi:hypothetical protein